MENKIMMPASYNVLSCEEMTYTEGGATVGQAVAAWLWPGYATVIGINTCREARKKDHDNWVSNVWSDIKADCKGNVTNTFYHAGMIFWNAASTISSFGLSAVMSPDGSYEQGQSRTMAALTRKPTPVALVAVTQTMRPRSRSMFCALESISRLRASRPVSSQSLGWLLR